MKRTSLLAAGALALLLGPALDAHAQVVVYNNTTTYQNAAYAPAGATAAAPVTYLDADDINTLAGVGGLGVTSLKFSVANFGSTATSAVANLRFYATDGTGGLPGTYLGGVNLTSTSFAAGKVNIYTYTPTLGTTVFTIPTNGSFWAGIAFTGASVAKLNNLGEGLYNPPTVGSSTDTFFETDNAGTFASSNPAGALYNFAAPTVANFGWEFEVATLPVLAPEPSQFAAFGIGLLGLGALALRARRRQPAA